MWMSLGSVVPDEVRERLVLTPWSEVATKMVLAWKPSVSAMPGGAPERQVPVHSSDDVPEKQVETEVEQRKDEECLRPVTCPPQPQPQRSWEG